MIATVTFRGEERRVEYTATIEPDVNYACIEWGFEGLTPDDHDALKITDEEEQAIQDLLWKHYDEYDPY